MNRTGSEGVVLRLSGLYQSSAACNISNNYKAITYHYTGLFCSPVLAVTGLYWPLSHAARPVDFIRYDAAGLPIFRSAPFPSLVATSLLLS
jgi:hypothetical protein